MNRRIILIIFLLLILILGIVLLLRQTQTEQDPRSRAATPQNQEFIEEYGKLVEGFPDFPVYPGATLKESSRRLQPLNTGRDIRAEWIVPETVPVLTRWYVEALHKEGWTVEDPDNITNPGEQVVQISKGNLGGYIAIEDEQDGTSEVVIDFAHSNKNQ